ncbi:MAG: leucine-rich repeat domain-containing protein [Treponema sp.]|nr:leucine-rich repeat domain-containing protein [Treponema sp.]
MNRFCELILLCLFFLFGITVISCGNDDGAGNDNNLITEKTNTSGETDTEKNKTENSITYNWENPTKTLLPVIEKLKNNETLKIVGEMTSEDVAILNNALITLDEDEVLMNLDMSEVTGLQRIGGTKNGNQINADYTFFGCKALKSIVLPPSVTAVGICAFAYCTALNSFSGKNIITIGQSAFFNCTGLVDFQVPSKTTCIGDSAFQRCSELKTVHIGAKLFGKNNIGNMAFDGCNKLEIINYGRTAAEWEEMIEDFSNIPSIRSGVVVKCTDGDYKM